MYNIICGYREALVSLNSFHNQGADTACTGFGGEGADRINCGNGGLVNQHFPVHQHFVSPAIPQLKRLQLWLHLVPGPHFPGTETKKNQ